MNLHIKYLWLGHVVVMVSDSWSRGRTNSQPCNIRYGNDSGQIVHTHVPLSPSSSTPICW